MTKARKKSISRGKRRIVAKASALPGQIEFRGARGTTQPCVQALGNFLQERREKGIAMLLSGPQDKYRCRSHAFLLVVDGVPEVLVSDGFSSGYMGEGPHGLISAISLLSVSGWDIREVKIGERLFEKICSGGASWDDLIRLIARPSKPISHVYDYMPRDELDDERMSRQWGMLPVNIPLALIDSRLLDIAVRFWRDPDAFLGKAYRRLEDLVRRRCGRNVGNEPGAKLFSKAFGHDSSQLVWRVNGEDSICYAPLFTAAYLGFRNLRAHRDPGYEAEHDLVLELLQLNQLFVLESQLVVRERTADSEKDAERQAAGSKRSK